MSRNKNADFTRYVHEFVDKGGTTRYAVGEWNEDTGQFTCPMDAGEVKATGCHTKFAKKASGLGGYLTRAQALRRARYLYGKGDVDGC